MFDFQNRAYLKAVDYKCDGFWKSPTFGIWRQSLFILQTKIQQNVFKSKF